MRKNGNNNAAIPLPALEGSIVVLGFIAIFINAFFLLYVLINKLKQQEMNFSKYLLWFNIAVLPVQIWYFFFSSNIV
jgi:undecaprenyl pyrophosphate phosphatase UppP